MSVMTYFKRKRTLKRRERKLEKDKANIERKEMEKANIGRRENEKTNIRTILEEKRRK